MKKIAMFLFIILVCTFNFALSPDEAVNFVSKTNNYLLSNEQAAILAPQVMINYKNQGYWIVAGISGSSTSIYIPINDSSKEVASGDVEIRELIKTQIVLNKLYELKSNYPVGDWPFSRTNQTNFETLKTKLNDKIPSYTIIETNLASVAGAEELINEAQDTKILIQKLSEQSELMALLIEDGIDFEQDYFSNPDTNETNDYKALFEDYFDTISIYKKEYQVLQSKVDVFRNNIGAFSGELSASEKEYYNSQAKLPNETALLSSVFSRADETQTFVEEIFNSIINIENLVLNLSTRKERNDAWLKMYSTDNDILKLNSSLTTLEKAATTILNEDNVNYWNDQDSVSALKTNWNQAQTKYNNGVYTSASEFAKSAKKNVLAILENGIPEPEDIQVEGLLINIIVILIIAIIGVFLLEKFYLEKKKKKEMGVEEDYENYP